MSQNDRPNLHLSGVGSASGGTYGDVKIEGVGRVHGDIECRICHVEGVGVIHGNVKARKMNLSGKSTVKGNISADNIILEGYATIHGNCDAETFSANGAFTLNGLLNAGDIDIRLHGSATVQEIGGESIHVSLANKFGLFNRFKKLSAQVIEGDEVYLEFTKADVVRGNKVSIGRGCQIGLVEYRTDLEVVPESNVSESKKM